MTNNIAVLGLGIHQLNSIRYLKRYYNIIGFDEDINCPGKKYVKKFFCIGLNKKKKILSICKKNKIKFAATFCNEHFLRLTSQINGKLGLENHSKLLKLISNKYLYKKKIIKVDKYLVPEFCKINKFGKSKKVFSPGVVKPITGSGSRGVIYIKNNNEFNRINLQHNVYKKGALLEKYIPGPEYAIDGWVFKKNFLFCCISEKKTSSKPYLLDKSLIINSKNKKIVNAGHYLIKKLIKIFKINNLPIHLEFKISNRKPKIIDFSLRGAGFDVYTHIMSKIINQNTTKIQTRLILNKKINIKKRTKKIFYLGFFFTKPGKIIDITGINRIKKKIKNCKIKLFKKIGETVNGYKSGADRLGQVIIYNNNLNTLKKNIKMINKVVKIHVI